MAALRRVRTPLVMVVQVRSRPLLVCSVLHGMDGQSR